MIGLFFSTSYYAVLQCTCKLTFALIADQQFISCAESLDSPGLQVHAHVHEKFTVMIIAVLSFIMYIIIDRILYKKLLYE